MQVLGMVYMCEALGFLKVNNDPPRCSNFAKGDFAKWAVADWEHTYERPADLWTHDVYGDDSSEPLCYDLAEAIRSWLGENESYKKLSMCEVALIDPRFAKARKFVGAADIFWSHVQQERVRGMFLQMIENASGPPPFDEGKHKEQAQHEGIWPEICIWADMFSLRQCVPDFDVAATIGLIQVVLTSDFDISLETFLEAF